MCIRDSFLSVKEYSVYTCIGIVPILALLCRLCFCLIEVSKAFVNHLFIDLFSEIVLCFMGKFLSYVSYRMELKLLYFSSNERLSLWTKEKSVFFIWRRNVSLRSSDINLYSTFCFTRGTVENSNVRMQG